MPIHFDCFWFVFRFITLWMRQRKKEKRYFYVGTICLQYNSTHVRTIELIYDIVLIKIQANLWSEKFLFLYHVHTKNRLNFVGCVFEIDAILCVEWPQYTVNNVILEIDRTVHWLYALLARSHSWLKQTEKKMFLVLFFCFALEISGFSSVSLGAIATGELRFEQ